MVLRTQLRVPGKRAYGPHVDLVWDTARGWTTSSLRQCIAHSCSLPVEKIEIAKYFPEKFEWLPISSWVKWWAFLGDPGPCWCGDEATCAFSQMGNLVRT